MAWKIGVDGGGSKTECILVDPSGVVVARHTGAGCSPTLLGAAGAGEALRDALRALLSGNEAAEVSSTLLCMAGSRLFWRDLGAGLAGLGRVTASDDSLPVLELATRGGPGLVLHSGTGSFVAARTPDGAAHYAGGLGWRFGDEGSGYDLGRRAIARALLEGQGWAPPTGLGALAGGQAGGLRGPEAVAEIAALAPGVLRLAGGSRRGGGRVEVGPGTPWAGCFRLRQAFPWGAPKRFQGRRQRAHPEPPVFPQDTLVGVPISSGAGHGAPDRGRQAPPRAGRRVAVQPNSLLG